MHKFIVLQKYRYPQTGIKIKFSNGQCAEHKYFFVGDQNLII